MAARPMKGRLDVSLNPLKKRKPLTLPACRDCGKPAHDHGRFGTIAHKYRKPLVHKVYQGYVMVKQPNGTYRTMGAAQYAAQLGRSKGGKAGKGHRWTVEEAKRAVQKLWKKRWRAATGRHETGEGGYVGVPAKRRSPVKRAPSRASFSEPNVTAFQYLPAEGQWLRAGKPVSETLALRALGYLPQPRCRGYVPDPTAAVITAVRKAKP